MALVEGVRGKLLPVRPYLLEHLGVVAVGLSAFDELWLHRVDYGLLLLAHGLAQRVALASGEVGELPREQHDLLLVDRYAVCVLEIFLHAGYVIPYFLLPVLARYERRDIVHWARTVEGVHGYEVFKHAGMELPEVFLHAGRLKLERSYRAALAIQLVG